MASRTQRSEAASSAATEHAFSCAVTILILARVREMAGEDGVARLLAEAGSKRTVEYLQDVGNWVGYDEAIALWNAGEAITHDPSFARHVGEDGVKVLGGSATAAVLRSLGSPEENMRSLNVSSQRWSTAAELEAIEVRPGYGEVRAVASPGFTRHRQHCDWTHGMLSIGPSLFGLPQAKVEHTACQALGAPDCRYYVTWDLANPGTDDSAQVEMLRSQMRSLSERLEGVFATASDLISTGDLDDTLQRIAGRAAQQVRAPKYLLAVRLTPDGEIVCHQKGLAPGEVDAVMDRAFSGEGLPDHWCVAVVTSRDHDYGRLVAMYNEGAQFFPQERELLELYARYAATALDSATALLEARSNRDEAQSRHRQARALLELARRLASAGSSDQIAHRLVDAIPGVVDCDRVAVCLWNERDGELVRLAVNSTGWRDEALGPERFRPEDFPQLAKWLERPDPAPYFVNMETDPLGGPLRELGAIASVTVPIATSQHFMGTVQVSVREDPDRLADTPELRDRLSGVAAHAVIALENGRLIDHITYQARHDQLTGLANRLSFSEQIATATRRTGEKPKPFALFYIDLDRFKPVNDEFGHEIGDKLLCAVADRLGRCARPSDTVARLGGDEFAVIVEGIDDKSRMDTIRARFQDAFSSPFAIDSHELSVHASIGQAVWPVDAPDIEGVLRIADATMYQVKHSRLDAGGDRGRDVPREHWLRASAS
jgi:diguanylate cyclase (GGDEF)-like protein